MAIDPFHRRHLKLTLSAILGLKLERAMVVGGSLIRAIVVGSVTAGEIEGGR